MDINTRSDLVKDCFALQVFSTAFWKDVAELVGLTEPIVKVLRLADSPLPTIGKIYRAIELAAIAIEDLELPITSESRRGVVLEKLSARKEFCMSDLIYAGYVIDPEFVSQDQGDYADVTEGWLRVVEKLVAKPEDRVKVIAQFEAFRSGVGVFGRQLVKDAAKSMPAHQF
jgi:hypothetical protein